MDWTPKITLGLHDRYCEECDRLLVRVYPDGSHEAMDGTAIRIHGQVNPLTGETKDTSLDAICLVCHPKGGAPVGGFPPEVQEVLRKMLDEQPEEITPGIKTPWGGNGGF